jgi:acyl-CoA thioester hydrolase
MGARTVTIPVAVRWSDQDPNGHVNNAQVVTLIEEARVQWRLAAIAEGGLEADFVALVANINLDYRRPVLFGPELAVTVGVRAVGARSYTLSFEGHQDNERHEDERPVFEATTVMVAIGADQQPRPLHDFEREFMLGWHGQV